MQLRQLFLRHIAQTSPNPLLLEIGRAEGLYLYTSEGQKITDLISGIAVSAIGHAHPSVLEATKAQIDRYMHTMVYGDFILNPQVRLAQTLQARLPEQLDSVYFVNSGAEAIEGAIKLAKKITARKTLIAARNAYHGSTHGAISLMSESKYTQPFRPLLPGVKFIEFNDFGHLAMIDDDVAAVVLETVQAETGIKTPHEGYLEAVSHKCKEVGALLILDEIQAGYGRTGSFCAFEQHHVVPDILCLAKALGGGMPLGAFISSREKMSTLSNDPALAHLTTFGGHPVSCAAALAALQVVEDEDLIATVPSKAKLFLNSLHHPLIKSVRHCGLWFAVDLGDPELLQRVVSTCIRKGILVDWFLFNEESIRICPPLIITEEEILESCQILLEVLDRIKVAGKD